MIWDVGTSFSSAAIAGALVARVLYLGWVTSPSRYFAIVLRDADSRSAILLMLSLSTRCQRRILPIVSTQITPGRSANHGVCQAAHFYVITQPQTCSVLRDNSQIRAMELAKVGGSFAGKFGEVEK